MLEICHYYYYLEKYLYTKKLHLSLLNQIQKHKLHCSLTGKIYDDLRNIKNKIISGTILFSYSLFQFQNKAFKITPRYSAEFMQQNGQHSETLPTCIIE